MLVLYILFSLSIVGQIKRAGFSKKKKKKSNAPEISSPLRLICSDESCGQEL